MSIDPDSLPLLRTADLLTRIRAGDAHARDELFAAYHAQLGRFLHGRLPTTARGVLDTQDLVQDVCAQALRGMERFHYQGIGSFWAFLRTIGLNAVRDLGRRGAVRGAHETLPDAGELPMQTGAAGPEARLVDKEDLERFDAVIQQVRERERNALLLRLELDLSFRAIAEECGYVTADAARMAVTRTLQEVIKTLASGSS